MDYFRILNLKKEPFSNSPDPEFFYPSHKHAECLQLLEMAIRLKRGLNVVLGEVGTGKTTLCRKLLQQLSTTTGKDGIELHLILDPSFSSPHEFLSIIAGYFSLVVPGDNKTEWQLKELIKNYLFAKGVDEGKIVVLLIDEGQMLTEACIEILREFLNYETNECKLLQIVIFAQKEFREKLTERANFANRINLYQTLTPLSFRETCRMVSYRISQTSENGAGQRLFTYPGLLALYRETGGFPRAINMLCHQVVLALIIQNRMKAGWTLVRACAGRLTHAQPRLLTRRLAFLTIILIVSFLSMILTYNTLETKGTSQKKAVLQTVSNITSAVNTTVHTDAPNVPEVKDTPQAPQMKNIPPAPGQLSTIKGDPITGKVWIQIARTKTLPEARKLLRSYSGSTPKVLVLPFWNQREGVVFALLLKERFSDRKVAQGAIKQLSFSMRREARILDTWDKDTIFYNTPGEKT